MAKGQSTTSTANMPNLNIAGFAEVGRKQFEAMVELQKRFFDPEQVGRDWATRAKLEADLAREFTQELSAAKSMPEVASVCQQWMNRRMELFAEDSRRLFAESQKFMNAVTQTLSSNSKGSALEK